MIPEQRNDIRAAGRCPSSGAMSEWRNGIKERSDVERFSVKINERVDC
jgi:hypothetical protein